MKKKLCNLMLIVVLGSLLIGCGKKEEAKGSTENEKKKIVLSLNAFPDDDEGMKKALEEIKTMDEFKNIEIDLRPREADYLKKMPIMVASGEQLDIIAVPSPILKATYAKGLVIPLDELMDESEIDFDKEYGEFLKEAKFEGKTVMVPYVATSWAMYYNKARFDAVGLPYPDPNVPMTWDEYKVLASKLTEGEGEAKKYGAIHLTWPMYWYGESIMALGGGEHFYNKDGLSNIENSAFSKALKRTSSMMHEDKSIPTYAELIVGKISPDEFMNGKYGMHLAGTWMLQWLVKNETYPRDWKAGIAPLPVDSGNKKKTWGIVNGLAIPQSSKHPKEALRVAVELTRIAKKYASNSKMVNQTVESPNLFKGIGEKLADEGISRELIVETFAGDDIKYITEKVTGRKPANYEQVINEEVEKYFIEEQSLEDTIKNIKKRGDKAIQKD